MIEQTEVCIGVILEVLIKNDLKVVSEDESDDVMEV